MSIFSFLFFMTVHLLDRYHDLDLDFDTKLY